MMEVAVGLEPTKTGFADQCLDRFGIATKPWYTDLLTANSSVRNR